MTFIPKLERERIEEYVFKKVQSYKSFKDIRVEKLHGYRNYYKIRFGDYRVGISFINESLTFERVLHRKDIYNYFP